jgi:GGDEF domain-containing protein
LSISVGLACEPRRQPGPRASDEGAAAQALFRAADQALYVAKGAGRNQVRTA